MEPYFRASPRVWKPRGAQGAAPDAEPRLLHRLAGIQLKPVLESFLTDPKPLSIKPEQHASGASRKRQS